MVDSVGKYKRDKRSRGKREKNKNKAAMLPYLV